VITVGNQFRDCQTDIGQDHYQQAQAIDIERLVKWLRPGDTVLVKGSNAVFWNSGFVSRLKAVLA
jgi:UDP-N-acetylmuramyl pentapeptide synthase